MSDKIGMDGDAEFGDTPTIAENSEFDAERTAWVDPGIPGYDGVAETHLVDMRDRTVGDERCCD